jgi:hypothetical protein
MSTPITMTNPDALISDVGGVPKFYANGDLSSVGTRWTRWKRGFELFAVGKGVNNLHQKKALLLHSAGSVIFLHSRDTVSCYIIHCICSVIRETTLHCDTTINIV